MYDRMPFGKFRGCLLTSIPPSYLAWVLRECDAAEPWLRQAVQAELNRRYGSHEYQARDKGASHSAPVNLRDVLKQWFAQLSMKYHPDRGGTDAQMRVVNEAHEQLRELLRIG